MKILKYRPLIDKVASRLSIIFFLFTTLNSYSQIQIGAPVQNQTDVENLVKNVLVGSGVEVKNIKYVSSYNSFTGAGQISSFTDGGTTNIGLDKGIILSTGDTRDAKGPNNVPDKYTQYNGPGDADLNPLAGANTVDAAVIEFDFKPASSPIIFRYIFASEEYPEWVCTLFNDIFAFFLTGTNPDGGNYSNTNLAIVPGTVYPVSINSINPGVVGIDPRTGIPNKEKNCKSLAYSGLYNDNTGGTTIQYDGFTKAFTAQAKVTACQWYHIKIAIADVYDGQYDSSVFLEASSFSSPTVDTKVSYSISTLGDFAVRGCSKAILRFEIPAAIEADKYVNFTLSGTAVKGTDYTTTALNNTFVTIPAGQTSVDLIIDPIDNGNPQGDKTVIVNVESKICTYDPYTVVLKDNPKLTAKASDNKRICKGDTAKLISSATGGWLPYNYKWSDNAGNSQDVIVKPTSTTTYTVSVYDVCGKPATTNVVVDVNTFSTAIPKNQVKDTLCFSENTLLKTINKDGDSPYKYVWTKDNVSIDPLAEFTVTNDNISSSPQIEKYHVTVTDNFGCKSKDSITIFKYPELKVVSGGDKKICKGGSTEISVTNTGTPPYTYNWSDNAGNTDKVTVSPETNTTYTVSVTDICKSAVTTTVIVDVNTFTANINPAYSKDSLCYGDTTIIKLETNGGESPYKIKWNWTNKDSITQFTAKNTNSDTISMLNKFVVIATDNFGCKFTDSITISNFPKLILNNKPIETICSNSCTGVIETIIKGGAGKYKYLWDNKASSAKLSDLCPGTYKLTITDAAKCKTTSEYTLPLITLDTTYKVYDVRKTEITNKPIPVNSQDSLKFEYSGKNLTLTWIMPDGSKTNDLNKSYKFVYDKLLDKDNKGKNNVIVKLVVNQGICVDTVLINVEINMTSEIKKMSNVLTPAQTKNKNFVMEAIGINEALSTIKIYNRFGKLVHEGGLEVETSASGQDTTDVKRYILWKGENNDALAGVYFYILQVYGLDNQPLIPKETETIKLKGTVTLLK